MTVLVPWRLIVLFFALTLILPQSAQAFPATSCPAMRDDQIAIRVDVRRAPPAYYDGEGWRVRSEALAKAKASSVAGLHCYYISEAVVTITMSGMTGRSPAPPQTTPDVERIRRFVASLIRKRNGVVLSNVESDSWQRTALNDINRAARSAISELSD